MKIGIYFTPTKEQGGVYQYSTTLLEALYRIKGNKYIVVSIPKDIPDRFRKASNFKIIDNPFKRKALFFKIRDTISYVAAAFFPKLISVVYKYGIFDYLTPFYKLSQSNVIRLFEKENVDLIFYPTSSDLSFLTNIPAVVAIHDLQHRVNPQFKEVSAGGRWESREYGFGNICSHAFKVLVDSKVGMEDVEKYYHLDSSKIVILPFLPPSYLESGLNLGEARNICKRLNLPTNFIFYPAKFWPHKNHRNLIKAINILKKQGRKVNLVLTGSKDADFSTYDEIIRLVKSYGLEDRVFYLGYVGNKEISAIYKTAYAMVMPTFFGPTNIPIVEAWIMGTSVTTSNIRGCRDQLGDAGLLINPKSPADIAKKIWKIYNDAKLRETLIRRGKIRVGEWTFEDFSKRVAAILEDFKKQKYDLSKNN